MLVGRGPYQYARGRVAFQRARWRKIGFALRKPTRAQIMPTLYYERDHDLHQVPTGYRAIALRSIEGENIRNQLSPSHASHEPK
jgi:hypothetical protein